MGRSRTRQGGYTPIKSAKIQFIVTPVYKDKGESMRDILLKLMLADLEPA